MNERDTTVLHACFTGQFRGKKLRSLPLLQVLVRLIMRRLRGLKGQRSGDFKEVPLHAPIM